MHAIRAGFTLIEVLVVMVMIAIVIGMAGFQLTHDRSDTLRDEAQRLALALQNAQQQAILDGKPYAVGITSNGYEFYRPNKDGRLTLIKIDETLSPYRLPSGITATNSVPTTRAPATPTTSKPPRRDIVLFEPSGDFQPFTLILQLQNFNWYVEGNGDGEIRASNQRTSS